MRLPSDLIVGVMNAANPAKLQVAKASLAAIAASDTAVPSDFAAAFPAKDLAQSSTEASDNDVLVGVMNAADPARLAAATTRLAALSQSHQPTIPSSVAASDPYGRFEGFLLRTAFEEILPKADSNTYGDGFAGGVWRSMAAEQFANLFADQGGIGIADMMRNKAAANQAKNQPVATSQWPYFTQTSVSPLA